MESKLNRRQFLERGTVSALSGMLAAVPQANAARIMRVGGTGSANELMNLLGQSFQRLRPETQVQVVPALGSSGGIKAVADNAIDVAISARPLKGEESANLTATLFAKSPFVFATSHVNPGKLTITQLAGMYRDPQAKWHDGSPARIILRPVAESDNALVSSLFPEIGKAIAAARSWPDVPIAINDQDNAVLAQRIRGSIIAISLMQLRLEQRDLRVIELEGRVPSLAGLVEGTYPYARDFHLVYAKQASADVQAFHAFLRSPDGVRILREAEAQPQA